MKLYVWSMKLLIFVLLSAVAGCGGSSGGGGIVTTPQGTLTLDVSSNTIAAGQGGTATATFTTPGTVVTFWSSASALVTFSSATVTTNANGVANTQFTVANSVNDTTVTIHASVGNMDVQQVITVKGAQTVSQGLTLQMDSLNLGLGGKTNVNAKITDTNGQPISGVLVSFVTTLGTFNPATGTATSDANGNATIQFLAGSVTGAGVVTATAAVNGTKITKETTFAVNGAGGGGGGQQTGIHLSSLTITNSSLLPGESTNISVTLTDDSGALIVTPTTVSFTSIFGATGDATLVSPVRSVNGVATSTYTAGNTSGPDTITVSAGGVSVTGTITITPLPANSISFISVTPKTIALKGMGGLGFTETATVVFKVTDSSGLPKVGQLVDFALNTTVGGLTLVSSSGSTGVDGTVSTIVKSGIVATPVRVTASVHGSSPLISTQSDQLVVSTGIPSQNGFGLAVTTFNTESYGIDGVSDVFTARLADRFGNPVPDGTAVYFSAQVGSIDPSCTTVNGACAVTWRSTGLRTADGRSAILAYAIGEESFTDANGNGTADGTCSGGNMQINTVCGEFTDTTQAYRDDAHTGTYVAGDPFIDFNGTGKVDRDGIFNGIIPGSVSASSTKHVFMNNVIVMSTAGALLNSTTLSANAVSGDIVLKVVNPGAVSIGDTVDILLDSGALFKPVVIGRSTTTITIGAGLPSAASVGNFVRASATTIAAATPPIPPATANTPGTTTYTINVSDLNNNPMAVGSTVTISSLDPNLVFSPTIFTVPNTRQVGGNSFPLTISNSNLSPGSANLVLTATSVPSGIVTTRAIKLSW